MQIVMDWSAVTFDWNRARAFLVTAEERSLSAAARALGLAQPTLSRQVEALQQELGVVLFERFGRGLELTPAGADLVAHARRMGEGAMGLSIAAAGQGADLAGPVTLSISDAYAGLILPGILRRMKARAPEIVVRVLASNDPSDLMRREADIAVRNFRPKEPDLIARLIAETGASFYASDGYLSGQARDGKEATNWSRLDLITPGPAAPFLQAMTAMGLPVTEAQVAFECSSYLAMWEMVREGLGVGVIDVAIGDATPGVSRVAPDQPLIPFPVWLAAHRDILTHRRLRLAFDLLAEELGAVRRSEPEAARGGQFPAGG